MDSKGSFQNQYEEYSAKTTPDILNDTQDQLSEKCLSKLQSFQDTKLTIMNTTLKNHIFHDGTVYTGSAGFAMYYVLQALKSNNNVDSLKTAMNYINLGNLKGHRISFLCGDAGPLALATVISYKLGSKRGPEIPDYKLLVKRLMCLISLLNDSPDEILYGKAGYLYSLLFVINNVSGEDLIPAEHLERVIHSILNSGKQLALKMKLDTPLLWQWHEKIYFGGAHGIAGILYMLLQASLIINIIEVRSFIKPTLDWLLSYQFPSGNFPSSLESVSGDRLVQWCHGAPGFVPLCILAHQVFQEDRYMKIATKLGEVIWERGLVAKGYSLCHGVSGNAYAFIQLYQATKNPMYLYRASCFMEWCAIARPGTELHHPDRPASLFEGLVGRLYLAQDLTNVNDAKFPGYSI